MRNLKALQSKELTVTVALMGGNKVIEEVGVTALLQALVPGRERRLLPKINSPSIFDMLVNYGIHLCFHLVLYLLMD